MRAPDRPAAAPDPIPALLAELYEPDEAALWWGSPQAAFSGRTPAELIAEGRAGEVERALRQVAEGVYL